MKRVTHLTEVGFPFIFAVRGRWRRRVVVTATRVPRGRAHRKRRGPARCPPPVRAVTLAVQVFPAACPLLLAHLLLLHSLSQQAVIVIIPTAPGSTSVPPIPLHVHQIIAAAAAFPREVTGGSSLSSSPIFRGVVTTPAVIKVAAVATAAAAAAGTGAPVIVRTADKAANLEETEDTRATVSFDQLPNWVWDKLQLIKIYQSCYLAAI